MCVCVLLSNNIRFEFSEGSSGGRGGGRWERSARLNPPVIILLSSLSRQGD